MDTQGAFSCNTTVMDCTTIFTLSFLLSSIQIYNLSSDITEADLEHLQVVPTFIHTEVRESESEQSHNSKFIWGDVLSRPFCLFPFHFSLPSFSLRLKSSWGFGGAMLAPPAEKNDIWSYRKRFLDYINTPKIRLRPSSGRRRTLNIYILASPGCHG